MRNILFTAITVFLFLSFGCVNHNVKEQLPENAFPIIYRSHLYIEGEVDSIKGNYVFDTGASGLYFDTTFYSRNSFDFSNILNAKAPGAGTTLQDVIVIRDTVGFLFGTEYYQTAFVPVLNLKPILGDYIDGLLGLEYFNGSVLEINYEHEYMRRLQSIDSLDLSDFSRIKLKKEDNRLYIPLEVQVNDSITITGDYQLDFGAGGNVTLTSSAANTFELHGNIEKKTPFYTKYGGVGGESSSYVFRAASLQIADFVFDDVTMSFSSDKSGALASDKHFGLLGNGIYDRFHVFIDFQNNDLYLKPNSNYNEPFEFSRLGFSYVDRNQTMDAWIVTGLYGGCNAEKQGLKIDDEIISVNGISIHDIGYESQEEFFKELSKVVLTIKRNNEMINIGIDLEPVQYQNRK